MDSKTLEAYSKLAPDYSREWFSQPEPTDMYDLIKKYFIPGGKTADIGCGNGRDANWMSLNGFAVSGFDSSAEFVKLAGEIFPQIQFRQAFLPRLSEVVDRFDNVLCETVIMHLPKDQIAEAIRNLQRILKTGGILYLSWRVTEGEDSRHQDGRLYSSFDADFILRHFPPSAILHFSETLSSSSGKRICRLICRAHS